MRVKESNLLSVARAKLRSDSESRPIQVLIAHPGRQYSHQMARALADSQMLQRYICGVPTRRGLGGRLLHRLLDRYGAAYEMPIDPRLVEHNILSPLVNKTVCRLIPRSVAASLSHRADGWFDALVAWRLRSMRPDVVVAYENSALHTFRIARELGVITVLDAASFHYIWQDRFYKHLESERAHQRVIARKSAEIALADHVLCVSQLARESYLEAGVPAWKVHSIPLGATIEADTSRAAEEPRDGVRFVFVGHLDERKGVDVLLSAFNVLRSVDGKSTLALYGKHTSAVRVQGMDGAEHHGWLPQRMLAAQLPRYDVLVLPSRHDSFGMVVPEAMACGLPVIVSENVGAKEMVTPEVSGLIVPANDPAALADAMRWFVDHSSSIPAMSVAAKSAAGHYSWHAYRERIIRFFTSL